MRRTHCADPFSMSLACQGGHRLFLMPQGPSATESARAATANYPELENLDTAQVAEFWLADPTARTLLNQQLAELLRGILEGHFPPAPLTLAFCPICATKLVPSGGGDGWTQGLRCSRDHRWEHRGSQITYVRGTRAFTLITEPSEGVAHQLASGWLEGNPAMDTNLHLSVRRVLEHYASSQGAA